MKNFQSISWVDSSGVPLTCHEKIKVLTENLTELQQLAQDVLEEALVMKADENQIRSVLEDLIKSIENPYA